MSLELTDKDNLTLQALSYASSCSWGHGLTSQSLGDLGVCFTRV